MIVPQPRLLLWFAALALPLALLGAAYPEAAWLAAVIVTAFVTLALADAVFGHSTLDGLAAELPEVVRFSKERAGVLELRLRNERQTARRLRVGLAFPREIQTPRDDLRAVLSAGSDWSRLQWPCTPLRRGCYRLDRVHLEGASPLGFWAVRSSVPARCEIRVYPNLLTERRDLAALFLNRGAFGLHALRQVGKGRDFEKLREYSPGDSFDDIHWKATARRGHPITKVFQLEKTQEVYVVIDASRLSARHTVRPAIPLNAAAPTPTRPWPAEDDTTENARTTDDNSLATDTVLERFITAALVLGLAAEQQGDLFGLMTFADGVEKFLRARNGKSHYSACRDALYTLEPRLVTPDFDDIAPFIRLRLRRRALLVFLTALDDPVLAENFVRNMDLLCRQHLVLVNMLKPPGAEPLFSNPAVAAADDLYRHLGGHIQWHNLRELEKVLQRRGVRFALLEHERLSAQLVSQYLEVKRRQLL